jgi:hypothetical protein
MAYKEIKGIVRNVKRRLKSDKNRPYKTRKKGGAVDRFGKQAYEYGEIDQMLTQPLGFKEFSRLSEGDKQKTWRFAAVIPPETLELDTQVQYKNKWYEVKQINDWDSIMSAHMVVVK